MNLFLIEILIVAVLIVGLIAFFFTKSADRGLVKPLAEPVEALPPVLLPEAADIRVDDLDRLRFSTGLRGYRADQVDDVLDRLMQTLALREAQIKELGGSLDASTTQDSKS